MTAIGQTRKEAPGTQSPSRGVSVFMPGLLADSGCTASPSSRASWGRGMNLNCQTDIKRKSVNLISILLDYLSEEKKGSFLPETSEPLTNTTPNPTSSFLYLQRNL